MFSDLEGKVVIITGLGVVLVNPLQKTLVNQKQK